MHENIGYSIYFDRETFRGTTSSFRTSFVLLHIHVGHTKNAYLTMYVQGETLKIATRSIIRVISIKENDETLSIQCLFGEGQRDKCSHNVIGLHQTTKLETHKDNNANLKAFLNTAPSTSVGSSSPNV